MNVLFLSIALRKSGAPSMYESLMQEFIKNNHKVYIATAVEKHTDKSTNISDYHRMNFLEIATGNITGNVGLIEKGIATLSVDYLFKRAISKCYSNVHFDLIIYPTPPITLVNTISWVKKRDHARTYLLLKDIFPQNAVDLGMLTKSGVKGVIYKYFRAKETKLYAVSDYIGCMSEANVRYVLDHNPEIPSTKVEVCPNCIEPVDMSVDSDTRVAIREKYDIPLDKKVFVYGGNLGKPQGIPFVIECLRKCQDIEDAYFLIVGDGTEYHLLSEFVEAEKPTNVRLMKRLPKEDYDSMVGACDVGLIFLDHRFTIPNFPSRLLSYMQRSKPVIVASDPNTDMGEIVEQNGFGWKCMSNDSGAFVDCVNEAVSADLKAIGRIGHDYLVQNYTVQNSYEIIMEHFK